MADFEDRLRAAVTEHGDGFSPSGDLPDRIRSRVVRRRRQQRMLTGGLAAGVATAALVAGVLVTGPGDDGDRVETAGDRTTSTSTTTAEPPSSTGGTTPTSDGLETTTSATTGTTVAPSETPSTTEQPPPPGPGPTTATSPTTEADLRPADSPTPAAGTCGAAAGAVVEITINPDVPSPRCVQTRPDQSLRVRNAAGEAVDVSFGGRSARLAAGASEAFPRPFGEYLEPGVHRVTASIYAGGGAEIYLAG